MGGVRARVRHWFRARQSSPRNLHMPGSPDVVKTRQPAVPSGESTASPPAPVLVREAATRKPSGGVSKIAWIPQEDLGHSEWLATGRRLGAIGRCSQWWIGDWIRYGTSRWGEKYAEAARVTGYDVASLRNMAWVASRFSLSLRSDKLAWSHHVLLAPLETAAQKYWLERASEERLSVADLRLELRAAQNRDQKAMTSDAAESSSSDPANALVCPHCGHELPQAPT